MVIKNKTLIIDILFSIFISFLFLLIASKNSFLYPMNDWVDIDCIFTVGKSLKNGTILYKDIFEHKGPVIYLISYISSFISSNSFIGFWLFEIIAITGILFFTIKITRLFLDNNKIIYFSLPIVGMLLLSSKCFSFGGSCEEFMSFPLCYSLYYFLKLFKHVKINKIEHILNGVCLSLIFWTKFNMIGFYIAVYFVIVLVSIIKKTKEYIVPILFNLVGFFIITFFVLFYFIYNNALFDLFKVYFYDNIFVYGEKASISTKLLRFLKRVQLFSITDLFVIFPMYISFIKGFFSKKNNKFYFVLFFGFLLMLIGIYIGKFYDYYLFLISAFSFLIIIFIDMIIKLLNKFFIKFFHFDFNKIKFFNNNKMFICLIIINFLLCFIMLFSAGKNIWYMKYNKEDLPQYKFAEIINSVEDATILNYRFLDAGFYHASGILPINKYFYFSNLVVDEMVEEQDNIVKNGQVDFIITRDKMLEELIDSNDYELILNDEIINGVENRKYYLYKKIE